MRAVWSFWSEPFRGEKGRSWQSPLHHLLAWGMSIRLARKYFPETALVTDTSGKKLLVDALGLPFTHVSTELDDYRRCNPGWWSLSKVVAYRAQQQPFIHLDTDVFLWKPLPAAMLAASVFAQCPEDHPPLDTSWCPEDVERAFARHNLTLPIEWEWVRSRSPHCFREANCGIMGANRVDFIQYFASLSLDLMTNPIHAPAWAELSDLSGYMMLTEQFLLDACFEFHRSHPQSPFRGMHMRYLFPSFAEAYNHEAASRVGFTHLLGDAKRDPFIARRLEQRTEQEDGSFYRHCLQLSRHNPFARSAL
jgi:hypothetical protein